MRRRTMSYRNDLHTSPPQGRRPASSHDAREHPPKQTPTKEPTMPVIDVHTHMFTQKFMDLLKAKGGIYNLQTRPDGQMEIYRHDTPVAIPQKGHFDYALRMCDMDAAHIDMAIVSLTCPNVYWARKTSVARPPANPTPAWPPRKRPIPTASAGSPRCPGSI